MNKTQIYIVSISSFISLAMLIYPPFSFPFENDGVWYYFVSLAFDSIASLKIDFGRLLIQWAALWAITGIFFFSSRE